MEVVVEEEEVEEVEEEGEVEEEYFPIHWLVTGIRVCLMSPSSHYSVSLFQTLLFLSWQTSLRKRHCKHSRLLDSFHPSRLHLDFEVAMRVGWAVRRGWADRDGILCRR